MSTKPAKPAEAEPSKDYVATAQICTIGVHPNNRERVILSIDTKVKSFDEKGEPTERESISLHAFNLLQQIAKVAPTSATALLFSASAGRPIKQTLLSLALCGAKIEFLRTYHEATELKTDGQPYGRPTYTTTITKFVENATPRADRIIDAALIAGNVSEETVSTPNFTW